MGLRSDSYYTAARERIKEARFLHENRYYTLAMYVSGLAVECIMRAFRLRRDPTFDERHDLWLLWKHTDLANVQSEFYDEKIYTLLLVATSLWHNDYRFRSATELRAHLKKIGSARGIKGDFLKFNSKRLYEAANEIVELGCKQWTRLNKK